MTGDGVKHGVIHLCVDIRTDFVTWKTKKERDWYRKMFRGEDGKFPTEQELLEFLNEEAASGKKAIPLACYAPNADGTCPGHACEQQGDK